MKRILLLTQSNVHVACNLFPLRLLLLVFVAFGTMTSVKAQCIGPYQVFESVKTKGAAGTPNTMVNDGWSFTTNAIVASGALSARSGIMFINVTATNQYVITPLINRPSIFQFYYRSSHATNNVNFLVQWSTDNTFATGVTSLPFTTAGTTYTSTGPIDLSAYTGIYVRILSNSYTTSTAAALFLDDISWTSTTVSQNVIVVPNTVAAASSFTCNAQSVPNAASGISYNFYDQGGLSDIYNKSQNQTLYFSPTTAGEKVQFTFNSSAFDALPLNTIITSITVYNGNGTTPGTEFAGLNAATSVTAGTTVTSTDSSGYITVVFTTTNNSGSNLTAASTGFNVTVKCVSTPTITSLGSSSGCSGSALVINGSNLSSPTSVTVGGVAVSSIISNTGSVLTVIPASGASGTVTVTTSQGAVTSVASYTVNALPTLSSQPSGVGQTVCLNGAATALSVTATAGSGTISSYKWYSNTSASTVGAALVATNTTAATSDSYTPLTTSVGTLYYYVVVTNSNGCTLASTFSGAIVVNAPVSITASPSTTPQTVCVGGSITTLSVSATGGGLLYQWFSNTANLNSGGTLISGAIAATYTPSTASAMSATYYYCQVSNAAPCNSSLNSSVSGAITVNALPAAVTVNTSGTYCTSTTLTATNGGSGTIYYQGTTSGGTSIATASTSQVIATSGTYYFRAQSASGCWGTQGSATVTINSVPTAPSAQPGTTIGTTSFQANWLSVAGATGYFLDVSTVVTFATFVSGYTNQSVGNVVLVNVTGLSPGTAYYYRVRAGNGCGASSNSSTTTVTTTSLNYCIPSTPATSTTSVNSFSTTAGITNISNLSTGFTAGGYANYTSQSCSQYPSSAVNYSITSLRTDNPDQTFFYYIWVDWNNDGDFVDAGETIVATTTYQPGPFTGTLIVPAAQAAGNYRMRVSTSWFDANTPCIISTSGRGEMEDYTITVVAVPPCANSTPSALTSSSIFATGATISWTDAAMTANSIYNYYWSTSSTTPLVGTTPSGTVTGTNFANLTGLVLGQTYYFWVRSNCGTPSAWVGSSNFTTVTQDIVNMANGTITSCNVKFYDSGGSGANYSNNESFTYTFYPSSAASKLKVVFNSFITENNYDGMSIYNGNSTAAPLLSSGLPVGTNAVTCPAGSYRGTGSPGTIISTAADGSLTFKFTSDDLVIGAGWDALISCITVPIITSFTPAGVCVGTTPTVTLTGNNFTGTTSVKFNGVAAVYTVNSNTSITTTLPGAATTGYITVTNTEGTGSSTTVFSVSPIPATPNAGTNTAICDGSSTTLNGSSSSTSSSVVLTENFTSGAWPSAWTRTNNGGYNPGDFRTSLEYLSGGNTWAGNGYTGYCSYFYSYLIASGTSGEMISPSFDLSSYNSGTVTFWIFNSSGTDLLKVYANNNNGVYTQVGANYGSYGAWTQITIPLNGYTGAGFSTVRLKFVGTSDGSTTNIGVDDIVVSGSNASTFVWSPSTGLSATNILNPVASPTTTTTYTLTSAFASGCSISSNVTITVNPKPTVTISTPPANVCANSVIPVNVTGNSATYAWTSSVPNTLFSDATGTTLYIGGTSTATIYVKTPSNATITATGTSALGCSDISSVFFTVTTKTLSGGIWNPAGPPPVTGGTDNLVLNSSWSGSLSGCSCSVTAGTIVFNSGEILTLTNGLSVSGGSVTFNNGASLVQINNVANTGTITYKRNTIPLLKFDYTYWSTPVSPQTIAAFTPLSPLAYVYNPVITNWASVPLSTTMVAGKGYIVRAPSTYSSTVPTPFTASFMGVPNNGTYTTPIVAGKFNLIGNPYPSAISADLFLNLATNPAVAGTIYLWTHNTPINTSLQYTGSDYALYNLSGGVGTAATNIGINNSVPTGKIASGQGFMIKGLSDGIATFTNAMRVGGNNNLQFYRNSAIVQTVTDLEKHRLWLDITNTEGAYKQILVGYIEGATNAIDRGYDGDMVDMGGAITLYTKVADKKLSIQGKALPFDVADTLPLGYKSTINGTYTITLTDFDGLFVSQNIYIEDTATGVIHDMKSSAYSFATTIGTFEDRFILRFTSETLGITTPNFNENSVVVYKNTSGLFISTGSVPMRSVNVYDIQGRLLASREGISTTETSFISLPTTQQVLLVKITSEDGAVVTKKLVY